MDSKRHRVALIGCGNIALAGHIPAVLAHPCFELVGLCDVRPERLALAQQACGRVVPIETNYQSLLTNYQPAACILALHPEHSVNIAIDLLQRGVSVLDEKPLARTIADGLRLAGVVGKTKGVYQVAFCFRYCQCVHDVLEWTRSFTQPCLYEVSIYDERPSQHGPEYFAVIQNAMRHSSAINHEGSHIIDWMSLLNPSPIVRAKSSAFRSLPTHAGPNLWATQLDFADGSMLQFNVGWLFEDQPRCTLRILADNGRLDLDLFGGTGQISQRGQVRTVTTEPYSQAWRAQLDAFAAGINTGHAVGASIDDGLRALRVTIACEEAMAGNRVVVIS